MEAYRHILIIRFSSFGDIIQAGSSAEYLKQKFPNARILWLTKKEFSYVVGHFTAVDEVVSFDRKEGIWGLAQLALTLRKRQIAVVYDAHCNMRTLLIRLLFLGFGGLWIVRSKDRFKRFLLFKCRINKLPKPFRGILSYITPLQEAFDFPKIGVKGSEKLPVLDMRFEKSFDQNHKKIIALAPSAAWELKRWPLQHWKKLIDIFVASSPDIELHLLGGPGDHFLEELVAIHPEKVVSHHREFSLVESCSFIKHAAKLVISADTGILHVADALGIPTLALIGPTAFGFPSHPQTVTLEVPMSCRPCSKDGRGGCSQKIYQQCMVDITPENVFKNCQPFL
jgi:ADP-heptose:LPS heptosyltransferase